MGPQDVPMPVHFSGRVKAVAESPGLPPKSGDRPLTEFFRTPLLCDTRNQRRRPDYR